MLRVLAVAIAIPVVGLVMNGVLTNIDELPSLLAELLPWLLVVVAADLVPVPIWGSVELMMSFPVLLAAAFVFPPYAAGLLSIVGTVDAREFRREIPIMRGVFNRANVAASVLIASALFHYLEGDVTIWPAVLLLAFPALLADFVVNSSLLIVGARLLTRMPISRLIRNVYGGAQPGAFVVGYACFGLLAVLLATVYTQAGSWGLLAFAIPIVLARELFVHWKRLAAARESINHKDRILSHVSMRIAEERRDERLSVAAGIHDEILPPLYQVHLMGQVLRQDLASGRLLDLEGDVPDLLRAAEAAGEALRDLIRSLRESTLGSGGLTQTLDLLVRHLEGQTTARISADLDEVSGNAMTHLLAYQVAREALSNALRHSQAAHVQISLKVDEDCLRIAVADDGTGFEASRVDTDHHFGLALMRERVELAGGAFHLDSRSGLGTRVLIRLPLELN